MIKETPPLQKKKPTANYRWLEPHCVHLWAGYLVLADHWVIGGKCQAMCAILKSLVSELFLPIWVCDLEQFLGLTHENSLFKISYTLLSTLGTKYPAVHPTSSDIGAWAVRSVKGKEEIFRNTCFADWVSVVILPWIQSFSFKYAS